MTTLRFDSAPGPKMKRTDEGYLRGDAIVTRTGVFTYLNADGSLRKELRHPDDVLQQDSLDTMKMIPITIGHPSVPVDATNVAQLGVGTTGETVRVDGRHIVTSLTVTGADGINAISGGSVELSLGYRLDLIEEVGVYEGEAYTHRQTNVRYNHLALVPRARAGSAARINLDSTDAIIIEDEKPMRKVNLDGIEYDAAPEVANALTKAVASTAVEKTRADAAEKSLVKVEAERDEHKTRADKAEADLKAALDPVRLDAAVAERAKIVMTAAKVAGKEINCDGLTSRAIHEAALKARHAGLNLDGKSDDYVAARFDAALESLGAAASPLTQVSRPHSGVSTGLNADASDEATAYEKSVADLNAWRNKA